MTRGALHRYSIAAALLLSAAIVSTSSMLHDVETSPPASATRVTIRALTSEDQRQSNIKVGLLVERAKGPAAAAGIQRGDIVVAANGLALSNVDDLK